MLKIRSTNFEGLLKSHSGPKENTLATQSLDQVLNRVFEDQQGRWKQGETGLGMKPPRGVVAVMSVPPKQGLSHPFKPGSYFSHHIKSKRAITPIGRYQGLVQVRLLIDNSKASFRSAYEPKEWPQPSRTKPRLMLCYIIQHFILISNHKVLF